MQPGQLQSVIGALQSIAAHFSTLFYLTPEFWAVVVALAIGILSPPLSEWWRRRPEKSDLVVQGVTVTPHRDPSEVDDSESMAILHVGRVIIENKGAFTARSVEAYIESIIDSGDRREDFFPMPLLWTHGQLNKDGAAVRDIYPHQTVYLDIFNNMLDREMLADRSLRLAVAAGNDVAALSRGALGESVLVVKLYQESGQVTEIRLKTAWDGRDVPKLTLLNKPLKRPSK
ncbi:MAG: hypothetical protein P4L81_04220 [Candidatus Pacebacteria bacterium]|nr:hypothetical protein [Candidatus Paceibacterota bacterium]